MVAQATYLTKLPGYKPGLQKFSFLIAQYLIAQYLIA